MIWIDGTRGRLFAPGRNDTKTAAEEALKCNKYRADYEEECFAEEEITCLNCRYRRWTKDSFECMRKE